MKQVLNNVEAGKVTDELRRRGIPPGQRLRVVVETIKAEAVTDRDECCGRRVRLADRRTRSL